MEAYFLFRRGGEATVVPPEAADVCEEQMEDIGSPSDSESPPSTSTGSYDDEDDATSSSSSGSVDSHPGFEMSSLMTQLPIKRGLSVFFDGKSQSFASLHAVGSLEDLAKPPRKRLKPSRSCGGGLDAHRSRRLLSPRRLCPKAAAAAARKAAVARSGALAMLGAATTRPSLAVRPRPDGVATKFLVVS